MKPFPTRVTRTSEYLKWVESLQRGRRSLPKGETTYSRPILYRGQSKLKWPPRPRIGRQLGIGDFDEMVKQEDLSLSRFRQQLYSFRNPPPSGINLMAMAQHYKLRTRLLDWSDSPLVALWFAVSNDSNRQNSVVYAFLLPDAYWLDRDPTGKTPSSDNPLSGDFKWHEGIIAHSPDAVSPRIVNQQGYFTIHQNPIADLTDLKLTKAFIARAIVDYQYRENIRGELASFGFHEQRIYPELEGVAKFVDYDIFENR